MSVNVIDITSEAYALPVLHAFRFPHATVNGILLGHAGVAGGRPSVAEAVPLFHRHLELTAMLEVALNMIEVYARENGLEIVGYYQANAAPNNEALGAAGTSIVEKIQAVCKHAFALVVCSRHLTPESLPTHVALETLSQLVKESAFEKVVDFDLHLDDVSLDWHNTALKAAVQVAR